MASSYKHTKAHPGFMKVKDRIAAREHISGDRAGAILASAGRKAGTGAIRRNYRLKRIKG